jgi:hypothetical protein
VVGPVGIEPTTRGNKIDCSRWQPLPVDARCHLRRLLSDHVVAEQQSRSSVIDLWG